MKTRNLVRGVSLLLALIIITAALASCSLGVKEKKFSKAGMTITLTNEFYEKDYASYTAVYEARKSGVMTSKVEFSLFAGNTGKDISTTDYAKAVIKEGKLSGVEPQTTEGFTTFEYEKSASGKDFKYFAVVLKGEDAFWLIQFFAEKKNYDDLKDDFIKWAKTVEI